MAFICGGAVWGIPGCAAVAGVALLVIMCIVPPYRRKK